MSPRKIVLLSGPVCSGKSTLAAALADRFGVIHLKTREILEQYSPDTERSRKRLQDLGELQDRRTKGAWVRDAVDTLIRSGKTDANSIIVVDSVRIQAQIDALRKSYGRSVIHLHLTAPEADLRERYKARSNAVITELSTYKQLQESRTEANVETLQGVADIVIDSKRCTPEDVVARAASRIGLYGRCEYQRLVDVLVGGQYGSEGKGHIASYLASEYGLLVRVGGPNAGHKVYLEPDPFTFHHLPSGTFAGQADLLLGPGAVLNVNALMVEIGQCGVDWKRLSIDPQAMVIEDEDRQIEATLVSSIGSTGQGVGSATARKIMGRGNGNVRLARDVPELAPYIRPALDVLDKAYRNGRRVLLEGTQGTGLSIHHGHYPHVTSRDTTVAGCLAEAGISPSRVRKVIMVCRTYPIRVQSPKDSSSGPISQEQQWKEIARRSGLSLTQIQSTEKTSTTKRERRVGEFDWTILRQAASLNAPTDVALTFVDYLDVANTKARRFEQLTPETIRFIEEIEMVAGAQVSLISTRFHPLGGIDRRSW